MNLFVTCSAFTAHLLRAALDDTQWRVVSLEGRQVLAGSRFDTIVVSRDWRNVVDSWPSIEMQESAKRWMEETVKARLKATGTWIEA